MSTILFHRSARRSDLDLHTAFSEGIVGLRALNAELRQELEAALEEERQLTSLRGEHPDQPEMVQVAPLSLSKGPCTPT